MKIKKLPRARYFVKAAQKTNGLGRIRTGDLRRVKAEDFRSSEAFFAGEMTTRKANAPSQTV
jgi:hypothetical protein